MLLTLACGIFAFQLSAYDFVKDGIYYSINGSNVSVVNNGSFNTYSGNVIIPATVTNEGTTYNVVSIGYQSFKDCTDLTTISLPEGIVYLMNEAFMNCSSLTSITLPSTLSTIYNNVFVGCNSLSTIYCNQPTARSTSTNNFDASTYSSATLYVPKGSLSSYQSTAPWSSFSNIMESTKFVAGGIYYNITSSSTVEVTYKDTNFNSYSGSIVIPPTVQFGGVTYTVTGIGNFAFRESPDLTSVTIPSTVITIGKAAFYLCSSLTSLTLPNSVQTINDQAFREAGLTQITLSNHLTRIGYGTFFKCNALQNITLPNSLTSMGRMCFQDSESLTSVTLGSGLAVIPAQCFTFCENLSNINFPSTLSKIDNYAFYGTNLSSFVPTNGLDSIGYAAFQGCANLATVSIPASVSFIDGSVFADCPLLDYITVDDANPYYMSVSGSLLTKDRTTFILFPPAQSITEYDLPFESITTIKSGAFYGATNLKRIAIPASVNTIEYSAFTDCSNLIEFLVDKNNANYMSDDGVLYRKDGGVAHLLIQYPLARPDKHYSILNTTDTIEAAAFAYCSQLESVYIPKSVRYMSSNTFSGSMSLKRAVIDEGLTEIPYRAFFDCENLQSLYLPSTVQTIDLYAIAYTFNLSDLTIAVNGNAPAINEYAFYGIGADLTDGFVTVYVPSGMASKYSGYDSWFDGMASFADISPIASGTAFTVDSLNYQTVDAALNTKVTGVTSTDLVDPGIPPMVAYQGNLCTVTSLANNALKSCTKMIRAEVPFTVKTIGNYCFYNCSKVKKAILREGLEKVGLYAFAYIGQLCDITIPASVNDMSSNAFIADTKLTGIYANESSNYYTSIDGVLFSKDRKRLVSFPDAKTDNYTVPDGTQIISRESFRNDPLLSSIAMPQSLREILGYAFMGCTALQSVEVPNGVTTIGEYAFYNCSSLTSADLPATLTSLGYYSFANVSSLATLTVRATTPPTCETYFYPRTGETFEPFTSQQYSNTQLIVPRGCAQAYRDADIWKKFQNITEADFPVETLRGDANNDGEVDINDVTLLIDYVLGKGVTVNITAADVNFDDMIDINDVTMIINYVLGNPWPEPATIDLWYLFGDRVGNNPWENNGTGSIGRGLIPLYPNGEMDENGQGQLVYVGYFGATDGVMLIHHPGSRDDCWGYKPNGVFGRGGEEITAIKTGQDGYFNILFNTQNDRFYFYPYSLTTPITFNTINIVGAHSDWDVTTHTYDMTILNSEKESHDWIFRNFTVTEDIELKFAANNNWEYNWGENTFPYGRGQQNGLNIPVKKGTYDVYFNDITGDFNFIAK